MTKASNTSKASVPKVALILEDEADIRFIIESILTELGYFCINVPDIHSAIGIFKYNQISLMTIDILVPADTYEDEIIDNGLAFVRFAKKNGFNGKCICVSGFADMLSNDPMLKEFNYILGKPFTAEELTKAVSSEKSS
ncbi:MAG: response regulator [Oligoflexia bacterium]|nr:response regulator [Oligoflexia bacterium]